jgi:hypothetical protein
MGEGESGMSQLSSKELISELRALDLPGVAPIARAAAAEIERLQATNVPKNGDVYLALVRSGYSQHEAHEIASMVESMQCQRHDCEVMRDELQELRAVHEPKALRASIEGLAEAYERQSSISAAHGGHSAEAWQTVADDLRSLLEQEGAAVPPATGLERARDVVSDVARGLGGEARVGAILALNAITEAMVGTRASLPPSERPQFEIELPDGDTRKLHVWFTEKRTDGIWHISISVDAATTEPPREGYSLAYADQMRTALLRIAGWREIDRNSLGERLREIEEIAIAALMPTVTKSVE